MNKVEKIEKERLGKRAKAISNAIKKRLVAEGDVGRDIAEGLMALKEDRVTHCSFEYARSRKKGVAPHFGLPKGMKGMARHIEEFVKENPSASDKEVEEFARRLAPKCWIVYLTPEEGERMKGDLGEKSPFGIEASEKEVLGYLKKKHDVDIIRYPVV
jgi:hypothetical protein